MAGQASNPVPGMTVHHPLEKPVVVIGPQFLTQYPVDLTIASKVLTLGENDFRVTDVNGTLIFSVKSKFMSIHDRRHLKDAASNILVTLKQKIMTMHRRWQVFRGESTDEKDLLFTVKKLSLMQFRTQLDVFLASNTTSESALDFKVKGSWAERSCTIYLGDGECNIIVAQMAGRASIPVPATAVHHPLEKPVVVIGRQFLTQCPVDLTIANDFRVTDVNGTLIFSLKSKFMSIHARQHLKDAAGNIVVTLKQKIRTLDGRWQVLRGESTDEKDLLFSVKKPSLTKKMTELDVFLASNRTSERVPDFKVKGSTIYLGDCESNVIVARMFKDYTDNFTVTVYPNVDYAFIMALMVACHEINALSSDQDEVSGMEVTASTMKVVASLISGFGGA